MISLAYFLIFGIRTVTISAWYLPWLQWSFPDNDEKESIYVRSTVKIAFEYYCL